MADKPVDAPKKAPPRNDFKTSPLYKNSRALELRNRDPNFVYEWKTTDREHPGFVEPKLAEHEHGTQLGGYVTVDGWEVCHRQTDPRVQQIEARSDQGKSVDTLIRHGRQILCRMPKDEYTKYGVADSSYQDRSE